MKDSQAAKQIELESYAAQADLINAERELGAAHERAKWQAEREATLNALLL